MMRSKKLIIGQKYVTSDRDSLKLTMMCIFPSPTTSRGFIQSLNFKLLVSLLFASLLLIANSKLTSSLKFKL